LKGPPTSARISAAKNHPRNQRVILLLQASKTIGARKIPAIDGRDECQFTNLPLGLRIVVSPATAGEEHDGAHWNWSGPAGHRGGAPGDGRGAAGT
jgi:hypothetical protein